MDSLQESITIEQAIEIVEKAALEPRRLLLESRFLSLEDQRQAYGFLKGIDSVRSGFIDLAERLNKEED